MSDPTIRFDSTAASSVSSGYLVPSSNRNEDGSFDTYHGILSRVGEMTTYTLGTQGLITVDLLDPSLSFVFTLILSDTAFDTYSGYLNSGEVGVYQEVFYSPDDSDEIVRLFYGLGDYEVELSEAASATKITLGSALTSADLFDSLGFTLEPSGMGRGMSFTGAGIGDYINQVAYNEDEVTRIIERFGYPAAGYERRKTAISDIIEDRFNALTSGLSTLGYDTTYYNHEISNSTPLLNAAVTPITSPEADTDSGINFQTAVTTTTTTTATGTTSATTSATTTGTSGY